MSLTKDVNSVAVAGGVSDLDGISILPALINHTTGRWKLSAVIAGGGGYTLLAATGTVNGLNAAFTFSQTPTFVVSDGVWYQKLDNNGNTNWSGTTTVTMTIPPTSAIWGFV